MVGALNRTHIPHRPWSVHCEIEEGVPKALYRGAADLAPAKVGGMDAPGSNMTQKMRSYHTHHSKLFRGGYAV